MPDQFPVDIPDNAFTYASNVRFAGGYAGRLGGHIQVFGTLSTTPLFVQPMTYGTSKFAIYPGTNKIYADDGTTETDVTGTAPTGTTLDKWTGDVFQGLAILNNQVDVPQYWDGNTANNFATFPTWNANWRAKSISTYRNFIVAVNITKAGVRYPQLVKWSDAAEPGAMPNSWDEADPTILAGEFPLADTQGELVDAVTLGGLQIVYKTDSMYAMEFVGGEQVFNFRLIEKNNGLLSQNCAVAFPGGHACIGNGDIYVHNGGNSRSIISEKARDWFFGNLDVTNRSLCFACVNPSKKEVWFCAPESGYSSCTYALVWNWESDTIGQRQLPNLYHGNTGQIDVTAIQVWDAYTDVWDDVTETWSQTTYNPAETRLILASANAEFYLPDRTSQFDGTDYSSTLQRTGLVFGDPTTVKAIKRVWLRVDAPTGITIQFRIATQSTPDSSITWGGYTNYTVGTSLSVDVMANARFVGYEVRSTSGGTWRIKSITFEYEVESEF